MFNTQAKREDVNTTFGQGNKQRVYARIHNYIKKKKVKNEDSKFKILARDFRNSVIIRIRSKDYLIKLFTFK